MFETNVRKAGGTQNKYDKANDIKDVQSWKLLLSSVMKLLTRNPLPMRIQNLIKSDTLRGLISFHCPILLEGFHRKSRENVQKTLFRGSSYKTPKVKNYPLVNLYLSIVIQK